MLDKIVYQGWEIFFDSRTVLIFWDPSGQTLLTNKLAHLTVTFLHQIWLLRVQKILRGPDKKHRRAALCPLLG